MQARTEAFFDAATNTISYVVVDPATARCALIDPVLDFSLRAGRVSTQSADTLIDFVRNHELRVDWILETHVHADHLTAAPYLRDQLGGRIAIGEHISQVRSTFGALYNVPTDYAATDDAFDHLFSDGESFAIGDLTVEVLHTPGHTPACITYLTAGLAFVGDTLFMPDFGTARADFPGGDASALFRSIQRLLTLPDQTRLLTCHDYMPGGRELAWETTVGQQKSDNIHLMDGVDEAAFVKMRTERDANLDVPALLLPAIQVNMRGGKWPDPETNGRAYFKIPIDALS